MRGAGVYIHVSRAMRSVQEGPLLPLLPPAGGHFSYNIQIERSSSLARPRAARSPQLMCLRTASSSSSSSSSSSTSSSEPGHIRKTKMTSVGHMEDCYRISKSVRTVIVDLVRGPAKVADRGEPKSRTTPYFLVKSTSKVFDIEVH
ncbi:hypothetical protein F2P81_014396 [Scophthalmus maximus]|uniref:Uncharacterized protein n=1 Tax=Scophthalmus maximus TaxID=52904 RepID=A0A6A4SR07_SCOMX|nr:hypothetical protein F2P81_014396 [Scophthalmus maximus]